MINGAQAVSKSSNKPAAIPLDEAAQEALARFAGEHGHNENDVLQLIVTDWLIAHGYLAHQDLEEDSPTDGNA